MSRRGVLVFVFTLVSGLVWGIAPVRAIGSSGLEDEFVQRANAARAAAPLGSYAGATDLVEVARRHSVRMASEDRLHHNPSLGSDVGGWEAVGENVGVGSSVESIHRALMESPTHRDNLLSGTFTEVGMGVHVDEEGAVWVTQVFRKPQAASSGGAAPAPPPPAERSETKPAQVRASRAAAPAAAPAAPAPAAPAPAARAEGSAAAAPPSTLVRPAETAAASRPSASPPIETAGVAGEGRRVSLPIGVATSFLLAVVLGLLAEVGRYPLSDWRRQRNQASMSSSRSPSSTAWTLPVS